MTDVNKSYQFAGDFILEQTVANNVVLDILKRGNLPHKDFETGKETTVFKCLIDCLMICHTVLWLFRDIEYVRKLK